MERNGQRIADEGWAFYLAAQALKDERWRYQSPSRLARFYGDLGWKGTDTGVHPIASEANNIPGVIKLNQLQLLNPAGRWSVIDHRPPLKLGGSAQRAATGYAQGFGHAPDRAGRATNWPPNWLASTCRSPRSSLTCSGAYAPATIALSA